MAWIELHTSLRNHPKVIMLSTQLGVEKVAVIGHLICLWTWAMEYTEDGDLSRYEPAVIESACEWKGKSGTFYSALLGKFIDSDHFIHDWWDYAGKYLTSKYRTHQENKLLDIKRKYELRKGQTKIRLKTVKGQRKVVLPNQPNQPNQPIYSPDSAEFILSELLLKKILSRSPNHKQPDLQKWAQGMDEILRIDKKTQEEVRSVIEWCQEDSFWQNNILCPAKLRKQYGQLLLKSRNGGNNAGIKSGNKITAAEGKYAGIGTTVESD